MKEELELQIVNKCPELFKDYKGDPLTTCLAFGIECNDGWFKILDHLFGYLTDLMKRKLSVKYSTEYQNAHKNEKDFYKNHYEYRFLPPQIVLDQVKEKFGTLRVYYHTVSEDIPDDVWANLDHADFQKKLERYEDNIRNAIDYAEYQTTVTWEVTGKDGKLYTKGWNVVLCDEEAIKTGRDPKTGETLK